MANTIVINQPNSVATGVNVTLTGTWKAVVPAPTMEYKKDSGSYTAFGTQPKAPTTQAPQKWSVNIGSFATSGSHSITVEDGTGATATVDITVTGSVPLINVVTLGSSQTLSLLNGDTLNIQTSDGGILLNGSEISGSEQSAAIGVNTVADNVVWGLDAVGSGQWYTNPDNLSNSWALASPQPNTQAYGGGGGTGSPFFIVRNGVLVAPDGQVFLPRGSAVWGDGDLPYCVGAMSSTLNGLNYVRVACFPNLGSADYSAGGPNGNTTDISFVTNLVDQLIASGVVCAIGYTWYGYSASGDELTNMCHWYAQLAKYYLTAPHGDRVFFITQNEPAGDGSGVDAEIGAIYSAIRSTATIAATTLYDAEAGAGSGTIIVMCPSGANYEDTNCQPGMTAATYAAYTGVAWDCHFYDWVINDSDSNNLAAQETFLEGMITSCASFGPSADGVIPMICGEFGDATDGTDIDGSNLPQAVVNVMNGNNGLAGYCAWEWYNSGTTGDAICQSQTGGNPANPSSTFNSDFLPVVNDIAANGTPYTGS